MRTSGANNTTPKYRCVVTLMGEKVVDDDFTSLKKVAEVVDIPYHTITDVFEGRRNSFMKYKNKKFFPDISIIKLIDMDKSFKDVGGLDNED